MGLRGWKRKVGVLSPVRLRISGISSNGVVLAITGIGVLIPPFFSEGIFVRKRILEMFKKPLFEIGWHAFNLSCRQTL